MRMLPQPRVPHSLIRSRWLLLAGAPPARGEIYSTRPWAPRGHGGPAARPSAHPSTRHQCRAQSPSGPSPRHPRVLRTGPKADPSPSSPDHRGESFQIKNLKVATRCPWQEPLKPAIKVYKLDGHRERAAELQENSRPSLGSLTTAVPKATGLTSGHELTSVTHRLAGPSPVFTPARPRRCPSQPALPLRLAAPGPGEEEEKSRKEETKPQRPQGGLQNTEPQQLPPSPAASPGHVPSFLPQNRGCRGAARRGGETRSLSPSPAGPSWGHADSFVAPDFG